MKTRKKDERDFFLHRGKGNARIYLRYEGEEDGYPRILYILADFTDCRIPKENLLGQQGKGFNIAMHTLDGGRIGIAAQALGLARALWTTILCKREKTVRTLHRAVPEHSVPAGGYGYEVEAAKMLVYKAAMAKATQKVYSVEAAQAKLYAAEVAMEVTTKAVQLHGGYGYIREYDVERMMRDAKITEIYEGTSEVQRMVISGNLLK